MLTLRRQVRSLLPCIHMVLVSALGCAGTEPHSSNLADEDPAVRLAAATALQQMGPDARRATPHLIAALHGSPRQVRESIVAALVSIGPSAVPELVEALVESTSTVSTETILANIAVSEALGGIGAPAVPALLDLLQSDEGQARQSAIGALRRIGPAAEAAVPQLITILEDDTESATMHMEIAGAFGSFGPSAASAVPSLIQALSKRPLSAGPAGEATRHYAAQSLGRLGPEAAAAIPALKELLADQSLRVRTSAAGALAFLSPYADYTTAELQELIEMLLPQLGAQGEVGATASASLTSLGSRAVPALCSSFLAINAATPDRAELARLIGTGTTIGTIAARDSSTLEVLVPCSLQVVENVKNRRARTVLVSIITTFFGPPAVPHLMAFLESGFHGRSSDFNQAQGLVSAILIGIAQGDADDVDPVLDAIHEVIRRSDGEFKKVAVVVLGNLGRESDRVIEILEEELALATTPELSQQIQSSIDFARGN